MSSPTPSPTGNNTPSYQRIAIAAGTLIVVILTVVIALFLAAGELQQPPEPVEPTAISQVSPTAVPTNTPIISASPTAVAPLTNTPSPTATPSATLEPTTTPLPPATATDTPIPPALTSTPTQAPIVVTPTPLPATTAVTTGGACQPPPSWVAYTVQPGDTLNSLASRTNTSTFELFQVNCLESFTLRLGQTLYLPFNPPAPTQTPTSSPTQTPGPTPSRTPTPIAPDIDTVVARQTGSNIVVIVTGRNFRSNDRDFRVELVGPTTIQLQLGQARSSTSFEASAPAPDPLPEGTYDLVVINPDGQLDVAPRVFPPGTPTPTPPPPVITGFTPKQGQISDAENIRITIIGQNFQPNDRDFEVELRLQTKIIGLRVDDSREASSIRFEAILREPNRLTNDDAGEYDLLVRNPDGNIDIADDTFVLVP